MLSTQKFEKKCKQEINLKDKLKSEKAAIYHLTVK